MSIKLTTTNLEEIRDIAEKLLAEAESCKDVSKKADIDKDLDEVINYYKLTSKAKVYAEAKASDDAMKFAVTTFFYPTIRVKEIKDRETETVSRCIENAQAPIDLGDLHKKLEGIGADKKWIYAAEKFNYYLTIRAAKRVGATVNSDAFVMRDISREFDMGKNPCSNTQLLKTLQNVITMMLGDGYKATSHDVNYLVDCYSNDSKKSKTSITLANHKTLRNYLKKICYRVLTDGIGYNAEQKEIKEK